MEFGVDVYGYDSLLSKEEIENFGVNALDNLDVKVKMDGVIVAVAHDEFKRFSFVKRKSVLRCEGCLMQQQQKAFIIGGCNA
ncbi:hypothetical protein C5S29_01830 [ANME-1 cluster archaeon GoMg3.2]|nr:hypothetical protein [ANME-1 cluster archaeon GoMg3.2]